MSSLFRQQALEAASEKRLGEIHLATPLARKLYAATVFALLVACVGFVAFGSYTRRITASGEITSSTGVVELHAERSAVVSKVLVSAGDQVRKGQPILQFAVRHASGKLEDVDAELARSMDGQAELLAQQIDSLDLTLALQLNDANRRLELLQAQRLHLQNQADLVESQVQLTEARIRKFESLRSGQYISQFELDSRLQEGLGARVQLDSVRAQLTQVDAQISSARREIDALPLQARREKDQLRNQLNQLDQSRIQARAKSEWQLLSPVDGVVVALPVKAGIAVKPGRLVTTLVPGGGKMQAVLLVPGSAAGLVQQSQRVLMRVEAFPYQQYGHFRGRIADIDRNPTTASDVQDIYGIPATQAAYLATVAMEERPIGNGGRRYELLPGMRFQADVMLERRRLIAWIVGPASGFKQKLLD